MWFFVLLHGCSNSGLDQSDTAESGDSAPAVGLEDCPWVGEWELEELNCGSFPYGPWDETHDGATMVMTHDPAGGCAVVATVRGAECVREDAWHFAVPVGTDVAWTSSGITDCQPNRCKFVEEEPICKIGERAAEATLRIEAINGSMTAVDLLRDTVPASCGLDIVTTWRLK